MRSPPPASGCRAWQLPSGLRQVIANPRGHTLALQIREGPVCQPGERVPKGAFTLICVRCGAYATKAPRGLRHRCRPLGQGETYGRTTLHRVAEGGHPAVPLKRRRRSWLGRSQNQAPVAASLLSAPSLPSLPCEPSCQATPPGETPELKFADTPASFVSGTQMSWASGAPQPQLSERVALLMQARKAGNRDGQHGLSARGPQHKPAAELAPLAEDSIEELAAQAELLELEACGLRVKNGFGAQALQARRACASGRNCH